jgi:flagellar biosynthesis/type III secretory pathway M-ring protein FliF/YscJ
MKVKLELGLGQVFLLVLILVMVLWSLRRNRRIEKLEGQKSEAILYVENSEEPNPFIVYGMVKKQTDDEEKQKKALTLANERKKKELLKFLKTL